MFFFTSMRKNIGPKASLNVHCSFFNVPYDFSRFVLKYFFGVGSKRLRLTKRIRNAFLGVCNSSARHYPPTPSPLIGSFTSNCCILCPVIWEVHELKQQILNSNSFMSFSVLMQQFNNISFNVKVIIIRGTDFAWRP